MKLMIFDNLVYIVNRYNQIQCVCTYTKTCKATTHLLSNKTHEFNKTDTI